MLVHVLVAARKESLRNRLTGLLDGEDLEILAADVTLAAQDLVKLGESSGCALVIVDRASLSDPPEVAISAFRTLPERPEVIVVQESDNSTERAELIVAGARNVLSRALPDPLLRAALRELLHRGRKAAERRLESRIRTERGGAQELVVARSTKMQSLLEQAYKLADSSTSVLVLGETGVGKEWLARSIHTSGKRSAHPFVPVHCAALSENLVESELFGHEEGAFTGASRARRGHFELAHGGTLFLDEVADIPLHLQTMLLRVLQDRKVRRLGSEKLIEVDARLIAATNRDLEASVAEGSFREDLWYRLAVVVLRVPPLRERPEDIPELIEHFLGHFTSQLGRDVRGVHREAMETLARYSWPGNVRELMNVVERAVLLCAGEEIVPADLALGVQSTATANAPSDEEVLVPPFAELRRLSLAEVTNEVVSRVERRYLSEQLRSSRGKLGEAAQRSGLSLRTLYDKMHRHGLRKEDFKLKS